MSIRRTIKLWTPFPDTCTTFNNHNTFKLKVTYFQGCTRINVDALTATLISLGAKVNNYKIMGGIFYTDLGESDYNKWNEFACFDLPPTALETTASPIILVYPLISPNVPKPRHFI